MRVRRLPVAIVLALLAGCSACGSVPAASATSGRQPQVFALRSRTIYQSPQHPGYTAWVGGWVMPDGSLMTAFTQATGPVNPQLRQLMPERLLEQAFGETENRHRSPPYAYRSPQFDFWGLHQSVVYLRSTDGGRRWRVWRRERFRALAPQAYTPQADIALSDGTLIRRVSGIDLANDPTIPHEALLETLRFDPASSGRQARRWSRPRVVLHDPHICTYQISRIHQLADGRLVATGQVWRYANGNSGPCAANAYSDLLLLAPSSKAAERGLWTLGMPYTTKVVPDEWDVAELPDGALLALFRTEVGGREVRRQAVLRRQGCRWVVGHVRGLPSLPAFQASGHPDLLATRRGLILSLSTSGTAFTRDGGRRWSTLPLGGARRTGLRTDYYPYAIEARDGTVYVFSHNGYDAPYGAFDESILMQRFRLLGGGLQRTPPRHSGCTR